MDKAAALMLESLDSAKTQRSNFRIYSWEGPCSMAIICLIQIRMVKFK